MQKEKLVYLSCMTDYVSSYLDDLSPHAWGFFLCKVHIKYDNKVRF